MWKGIKEGAGSSCTFVTETLSSPSHQQHAPSFCALEEVGEK